ncbi:glycosyltransferase [Fulvivirgaceae bacterium BMA12]|uniref:Glycosyltransferase n=1 Tax=Agaribacillus aureus TaxID=3051825 RepID=A0ABT8LFC2_9BACT|nr:glycosyltransferase [Fulvivirgaceae bacterium BMA12]
MKYKVPISVIMICNNIKAPIHEAIQSVLSQSFEMFELILVNNDSCNETEFELNKYKDSRIIYIENSDRQGDFSARNHGMELASGKYICMIDANHISLSDRLEYQYEYLESHPSVSVLGGGLEIVNENGVIKQTGSTYLSYPEIKTRLLQHCCFNQSTIMFRSNLCKKYGLFYNEKFKHAADYDFLVRVANNFAIRNVPKVLVQRKSHSGYFFPPPTLAQSEHEDSVRKRQLKQFEIASSEKEVALHLKLMKSEYVMDSDLSICKIWLNKLLEVNHQKKLYNSNYLSQLFKSSLESAVYTNALGGWSIEKEMLNHIRTIISKDKSILEFGSGKGTEALLESYKVTSIEHDDRFFIKRNKYHDIVLAPIQNNWYTRKSVEATLKQSFDLIIVDGPPGVLRKGILEHLDLFENLTAPIIFDDVNRNLDKDIMEKFCDELNFDYEIISGHEKEFAVCTKI